MKWLPIFLAINILCSTNGIALYEHFCTATESTEVSNCCSDKAKTCGEEQPQNDDDCCQSNFIDFEKLEVESYRVSDVTYKHFDKLIPFQLAWIPSFLTVPSNPELEVPRIRPPAIKPPKLENKIAFLQVFLC